MYKLYRFLGVSLLALGLSCQLPADEAGYDEEPDFPTHGPIEGVDLTNRLVVIDDNVYRLSLNLTVIDEETGSIETDFALRRGRSARFESVRGDKNDPRPVITGIWLQK